MRQMKDSGIAWVGEIPQEWNMCRVKDAFFRKNRKAYQTNPQILTLARNGVKIRDISTNEGQIAESYFEYNPVEIDDLLLNPMDLQSGDNCSISKVEGVISPAYFNLKSKANSYPDFYNYLFKTYYWSMVLFTFGKGVSFDNRWTLNFETLSRLFILKPTYAEQRRIADFLDRECEKIDGLKADIQAQIDTLEQYKRSVITETVTHGLNHNVLTKDSPVWFGEIPNTWKVVKGKYVFTQRNNRGNNIALQLLSPTQKYGVIPQETYEELSGMNAVKLNDNTNYALLKTIHKGDYCISLRSFQGGFEYSEYEGVVSPAYQVFYPVVNVDRGYYKYLFKEKGFIEVMNSYTMSLRDGKNIAFDDFGNTFIPVPPLDEQKAIAEYLDKKCAEIEQTIDDKKAQLDTLDEYKKSLIYEYVTGKKEVL